MTENFDPAPDSDMTQPAVQAPPVLTIDGNSSGVSVSDSGKAAARKPGRFLIVGAILCGVLGVSAVALAFLIMTGTVNLDGDSSADSNGVLVSGDVRSELREQREDSSSVVEGTAGLGSDTTGEETETSSD